MKLKLGLRKTGSAPAKGSGAKSRPSGSRSSLLTFLFFLGLSFAFWFIQSMQGDFTRKVYIPVTYDSIPSSLVGSAELPRFIVVQVQDKGVEQFKYSFYGFTPIHISRVQTLSADALALGRKELLEQVTSRLSTSAQVGSVTPHEVQVVLHRRASKVVPVALKAPVQVAAGYVAYPPSFTPDSVRIYGTEDVLARINKVYTRELKETGLKETITSKLSLTLPQGVASEINQVQVHIGVEAYVEHQFTLPISVQGNRTGYRLLPLPSTATIKLTIPRSRYADLVDVDFALGVDFPEQSRAATSKMLPIKLIKSPDWIKNYSIEPAEVQYVLEQS